MAHSIGRKTKEQIYQIGKDDVLALSKYLGDKPFFMGDEPTVVSK